jgi:sulfonate transport system permease protein
VALTIPTAGVRTAPDAPPRRSRRLLGAVLPTVLLAAWATVSATEWIAASMLPGPWVVALSGRDFFFGEQRDALAGVVPFDGAGWGHLGASLLRCAVSYGLAVVVGIGVGVALGLSRWVADLLEPLVNALRAVPLYAWLPLTLVWVGIGEGSARILIFIGALCPVLIATADAVGRVPRGHIETVRMLGTPRHRIWLRVHLPSALPEIVTGLRLGLTLAWMCVIVGELTGTATGVGAMMNAAREIGRIDEILVGVLIFAVVGLLADMALRAVARPWTRWSDT